MLPTKASDPAFLTLKLHSQAGIGLGLQHEGPAVCQIPDLPTTTTTLERMLDVSMKCQAGILFEVKCIAQIRGELRRWAKQRISDGNVHKGATSLTCLFQQFIEWDGACPLFVFW